MEEVEGRTPGPLPRCSVLISAMVTKHSRAPPGLASGASVLQRAGGGWRLENTLGPWAPPGDGEQQSEPASRAVSLPSSALDRGGMRVCSQALLQKGNCLVPLAHWLYFWADWTQTPPWDPEAVGPPGPWV